MQNRLDMAPIETKPLLHTDQASLYWLKRALHTAGFAFGEYITGIRLDRSEGSWSSCARLILSYQSAGESGPPASIFLKLAGGPDSPFADAEVHYYTSLSARVPDAPLPQCYHAAYSAETQHYHLLLEDLSTSHKPGWEKQWTVENVAPLAEAFARWHAPWWDHPELASVVAPLPSREMIARYLEPSRQGLEPLLEAVRDRISPEQLSHIRHVYSEHPHLMEVRAEQGRHFTCIHGDLNPGNILCPNSSTDRYYLIDRQPFEWSLQTWIGPSDLAYAIVHWWPAETRKALEIPLLKHYHQWLVDFGVRDYSWEELWSDYRLAALQSFYVVGQWCNEPERMAKMEWVWWPQLQKALQAYIDLECDTLLAASY